MEFDTEMLRKNHILVWKKQKKKEENGENKLTEEGKMRMESVRRRKRGGKKKKNTKHDWSLLNDAIIQLENTILQ